MNQQQQESSRQVVDQSQRDGLSELVVRAAKHAQAIVTENCGLCTIYCDKQVQYESVLEQYTTINPLGELFNKMDHNSMEVQSCRSTLFDEESVVQQVASRDSDDQ